MVTNEEQTHFTHSTTRTRPTEEVLAKMKQDEAAAGCKADDAKKARRRRGTGTGTSELISNISIFSYVLESVK